MDKESYEKYVPILAHVGDVPVYAFGRTYVYGVSPDFETDVVVQEGNKNKQVKIKPKKSWEISENGIGSMPTAQPRTPKNDIQPFLGINLIDGNPYTYWCSRSQGQPNVEPVWIRIDLAKENLIKAVVIMPRHDNKGMPRDLTIKVSKDAWHWETVYENHDYVVPGDIKPRVLSFEPKRAKQIWIIGSNLPSFGGWFAEHYFSIAEIQVIDENGQNIALASRGAGITVSSTNYGYNSSWEIYDTLWQLQYDLGAKWMRVSGSNPPHHYDTLQWRFVEQEKGKYVIDERTNEAITEAVNNGYNIMMVLCYGNWLYAPEPKRDDVCNIELFPTEWGNSRIPFPPAPANPEMREGFKNWTRFMVRHFKGRVEYWEIYNEPAAFGWEVVEDYEERVKLYCDLVKEVVPIIREEDPDAKISLGGMAGVPGITKPDWLRKCLEQDVLKLVDAIGWHVYSCYAPVSSQYRNYPEIIRDFQKEAEAAGFRGVYMMSEYWIGAPYPTPGERKPYEALFGQDNITTISTLVSSEIVKAKDTARIFVMNLGLSAKVFWCGTWIDYPIDGGLLRNTFSSDPVSPSQPQPVYYVIRSLCTIMDHAKPTELEVEFSNKNQEFDNYNFTLPDNDLLVGVWLPDKSLDSHPGVKTDVVIKNVKASRVVGIDTLNGFEQELEFNQKDNQLTIPKILIRDYPLMLKLFNAKRKK